MKKLKKTYLVSILIILSACSLSAQDYDSLFYYRGQIISKEGKYPVAFAHIINVNQKWGVSADTSGYFNIWVMPGDILNISAIGYNYLDHIILSENYDKDVEIYLYNKIYEIRAASISYLGTYKDFEYKVLNLKLPKVEFNEQVQGLFKYVKPPPLVVPPTVTSPASLIYSLFSKEAKDIRKYLDLEKESKIEDKVWKKYNEHIVSSITGLSIQESKEFIEFCNFQDKYILSITDYNLHSEIKLRYEAYKKSKQDSLLSE